MVWSLKSTLWKEGKSEICYVFASRFDIALLGHHVILPERAFVGDGKVSIDGFMECFYTI